MSERTALSVRFGIGDTIWVLRGNQKHKEFYLCPACGGDGEFRIETVKLGRVSCPDCGGNGRVWLDSEVRYYTLAKMTVGQVEVKLTTAPPYSDPSTVVSSGVWRTVRYMTSETGVGSGSFYHEANCFASEAAAVAHAEAQGWVTEAAAKSPREPVTREATR